MKAVTVVEFKTSEMMVHEGKDVITMRSFAAPMDMVNIKGSNEYYIPDQIEHYDANIFRIHKQGREYYLAANRHVWEFMYAIENPVSAEHYEERIRSYANTIKAYVKLLRKQSDELSKLNSMNFWNRLKFLFRGTIL